MTDPAAKQGPRAVWLGGFQSAGKARGRKKPPRRRKNPGGGFVFLRRYFPRMRSTTCDSMTFTGPCASAREYAFAASSMYTARV